MKKLIRNSSLLIIVFLVSCSDYLSVTPQGKVIPETDEEFASLIHRHINNIEGGDDMFVIGNFESIIQYESFADNFDANVKVGSIPAYAGDKINSRQYNFRSYFEIIRDCNIVIENILYRGTELSDKTCAAAYALKGICYYNMIREYCEACEPGKDQLGLPIVDHFNMEDMPSRESLAKTIEHTAEWLNRSIAYDIKDRFFLITADASKAYLARLKFWAGDWSGVVTLCEELLTNADYQLADIATYQDMIQSKNGWGKEIIIRSHINNNSDIDWYYASYIKDLKTRPVSAALAGLFEDDKENDIRYAISYDKKRQNLKNLSGKVRGSELVLMLAESYYHLNDYDNAIDRLNYLRRNRIKDVEDYTLETLPKTDETSLIKNDAKGNPLTPLLTAIFNERRKELYAEGDRWFELKRNGCPEMWVINNGLKYTTHKYLYTAPLYKGDVDLNKNLIQNEGYTD